MQPPQWIINLYFNKSLGNSPPDVNWKSIFLPVYFNIQLGSLTVPISSHCLWWVQPSEIKTLSPSFNFSSILAPSRASCNVPLYLASKIEKDVREIFSGTIFATWLNAWESVITSLGFWLIEFNVASNCSTWVTIEIACVSRISLITICCGKINLPFGAAESIGTTRTTMSPSSTKPSRIFLSLFSVALETLPINSFNS